jgi:tetratricopeptide (TPR) repeat protein
VNLAENKFKDAEDAFRRSYQLNPANLRGLMGVAETYLRQNKTDQAIQMLQAEVAKTPTRSDLHLALGTVGQIAGRWDMAISEFQTALSSSAKGSKAQGEMYFRIGETQRRKGDLNAAIVSLQAARQTLPDDGRVLGTLALVLDGAGRWPEAKQVYQATTKLYPNEPFVLNNLAFGMAEHGEDLDQALSMAQRAKQLVSTMPEISDTLGWIYLKKNLPDNAIQIFQDLVAKQPNQTTFRYHLGMALSQKGDKVRALQELKKALEGSPSDPERQKIKELITRLG